MVGVPELAGEENLLARHSAILDTLTNFVFIAYECQITIQYEREV